MENKKWEVGDKAYFADMSNYISFDECVIKSEPFLYETNRGDKIEFIEATTKELLGDRTLKVSNLYETKEEALAALKKQHSDYREELRENMSKDIFGICNDLLSALEDMEDADYDFIQVYKEQLEVLNNEKQK